MSFDDGATPYRPSALLPPAGAPVSPAESDNTLTLPRRVPPMPQTPNLDYVFDDPADGEPGRDRLLVHVLWEVALALLAGGLAFLLLNQNSNAFTGDSLRGLLLQGSMLGALAIGSAIALRAGAVNLAIGPVSAAAALYYSQHASDGLLGSLGATVGLAALIGLAIGIVVVALHVPAWAASLGAGLALLLWIDNQDITMFVTGYHVGPDAVYWFGGICAFSVFASLIGLVPAMRRLLGRFRPVSDPADRRGAVAGLVTAVALAASSALGGLAGALGASMSGAAAPSDGLVATALGLGIALLGGTSAFGRRGGVFGTVLATALVTMGIAYAHRAAWSWSEATFAALAIGVGLVATRLVERFGRPDVDDYADGEDVWTSNSTSEPTASSPDLWSTPPSQSTTWSAPAGGSWGSTDAWGTSAR
jgi:ribose/xylose/arabinose/galactoside ABC-type transport system permease subunit